MEAAERTRTGIGSLKIRFNRVFGYYIEVSKANLRAVPDDYHRKQTIAGGERFITPALKDYEHKVLGADEEILEREIELFEKLRSEVAASAPSIQDTARAVANLDVLAGLAETAAVHDYIKPHAHDGDELVIVEGRHPVVERHAGHAFVPNDVTLNGSTHQVIILTGPNMGGKSTYLRQTALIVLLAHIGSFVPANRAKVPMTDRIFARVGASDNIARGQSTFMVEMQETANILHSATSRSLVLLDEIGRGTATYDGLSIAWAVAEHLATDSSARPRTLFATHYHELTDIADALPAVANYHVVARRVAGRDSLPAEGRAGALGPQLRHSGRTPRGPAGADRRTGEGDPAGPRTGRAGAGGRTPGAARRGRGKPDAAGVVRGCAGGAGGGAPPSGPRGRPHDAAGGPQPAGGAQAGSGVARQSSPRRLAPAKLPTRPQGRVAAPDCGPIRLPGRAPPPGGGRAAPR